jgi:hypothetical protein
LRGAGSGRRSTYLHPSAVDTVPEARSAIAKHESGNFRSSIRAPEEISTRPDESYL